MEPATETSPAPTVGPLRELLTVAWPTVLTMTSYTVMQFVDSRMVSDVSPQQLAAQGNGGIFAFSMLAFLMGMLTVVNTYASQHLGAGSPHKASRYAWAALWISLVSWLVILLPFSLLLPTLFALNPNHTPDFIELETDYGQILLWGSILTLASRGLSHYFYGLHRPRVIFVATIIGNLVNVGANYVLIFGHYGFPRMELRGAALGTVIGTAVELLIPLCVFLGPTFNRLYHTRAAWKPDLDAILDLVRVGWPRSIQMGNEMICWSIFMTGLVGIFGEAHMAAGWIALRYMHLSFMPAIGISVAVTAVVGRHIGAGRPDLAAHRAGLGVMLTTVYMGACAVAFVLFREPLVRFFIDDEAAPELAAEILRQGQVLLICAAVFQLGDAVAITRSGALTGAGDTVWPGVVTVIASWVFVVGGGWLFVTFAPQLTSLGPWIGAAAFVIVLGIAFEWRWRSGRWRSINLLGDRSRD